MDLNEDVRDVPTGASSELGLRLQLRLARGGGNDCHRLLLRSAEQDQVKAQKLRPLGTLLDGARHSQNWMIFQENLCDHIKRLDDLDIKW